MKIWKCNICSIGDSTKKLAIRGSILVRVKKDEKRTRRVRATKE